jgi:hypothetical protein
MGTILSIPADMNQDLRSHLFKSDVEQLAFLLAVRPGADSHDLRLVDLYAVPPDGFEMQSSIYISLRQEVRAKVIKWAWDRGACLVEAHSHRGHTRAAFSPSDIAGFREFVPHVWWRLQGRPYAALVFTRQCFDALIWISGPSSPEEVEALRVEGEQEERPTGLTEKMLRWPGR